MSEGKKLVAVVSPWEKLPDLAKNKFRIESLQRQKMVMVWREDLQTEKKLTDVLEKVGVKTFEVKTRKVTTKWQRTE